MAARLKLKLPALKVTQRSTTGETVRRDIPRGCISSIHSDDNSSLVETSDNIGVQEATEGAIDDDSTYVTLDEPSLHKISQEASVASWNKIRPAILRAAIESSAMPPNEQCCMCTAEAEYRCLQCSSTSYFCRGCFCELHSKINLFHTGEVWEV